MKKINLEVLLTQLFWIFLNNSLSMILVQQEVAHDTIKVLDGGAFVVVYFYSILFCSLLSVLATAVVVDAIYFYSGFLSSFFASFGAASALTTDGFSEKSLRNLSISWSDLSSLFETFATTLSKFFFALSSAAIFSSSYFFNYFCCSSFSCNFN